MAGILFTDGKFVLAGFNRHKQYITGIGGKKKGNERPHQTAIRETLEELFELVEIPEALTRLLETSLKFDRMINTGTYTMNIMTFCELDIIFSRMRMFSLKSTVYDEIPYTLQSLILDRKIRRESEFSHLLLLPCEYNLSLNSEFVEDIYTFKNCENIMK